MTVCPIAIAVGCKKCPIFAVCPLKTIIGDQPKPSATTPEPRPDATTTGTRQGPKRKAKTRR